MRWWWSCWPGPPMASAAGLKRPALTHVLWVLVLVKLLTPPVFRSADRLANRPCGLRRGDARCGDSRRWPSVTCGGRSPVAGGAGKSLYAVPPRRAADRQSTCQRRPRCRCPRPTVAAASACLAGNRCFSVLPTWSAGRCSRLVRRVVLAGDCSCSGGRWRFRQYLKLAARPTSELDGALTELARSARLNSRPRVVDGRKHDLADAVWLGTQAPLLIFPAALSRQLAAGRPRHAAAARTGPLCPRRPLGAAAGVGWRRSLFWWHPVVWWARREMEAAEEECCDAWVVEQHSRRSAVCMPRRCWRRSTSCASRPARRCRRPPAAWAMCRCSSAADADHARAACRPASPGGQGWPCFLAAMFVLPRVSGAVRRGGRRRTEQHFPGSGSRTDHAGFRYVHPPAA